MGGGGGCVLSSRQAKHDKAPSFLYFGAAADLEYIFYTNGNNSFFNMGFIGC